MAPTYKLHRAGLGPSRRWVMVAPDDQSTEAAEALDRVLRAAEPMVRLAAVKTRAIAYPADKVLQSEIKWVADRLEASRGQLKMIDDFALIAIERGLDLLDSRKSLEALRDAKAQAARSRGGKAKRDLQKLPSGSELLELLQKATPAQIAERRGVKPAAVRMAKSRALKKGAQPK
jgi:hypothetical protein